MNVSIVIPAFNAARFLPQTLDSVRSQSMKDWELVLVDDGSTDETRCVAEDYAARDGRIRILGQSNAGVAIARNRGYEQTSRDSQFVCFLDADDVWEPDALEVLLAALESDPEAVAAHGLIRTLHESGDQARQQDPQERWGINGNRLISWPPEAATTFAVLVVSNFILTPGVVLIRRAALQRVGGFDPVLSLAADADMWLRLSVIGNIAFANRVVLNYRVYASSMSGNRRRMHDEDVRVHRKLIATPGLSREQRHLAGLGFRMFHRQNARRHWAWAKGNLAHGHIMAAAVEARHVAVDLVRSLSTWIGQPVLSR